MDLYNSFQQGIHIRGHYSWRVCEREREREREIKWQNVAVFGYQGLLSYYLH